jgi:hypothetical protein
MLTPSPQRPDDRGTRWLQTQVQHILVESGVALAPPHAAGDPGCYWGTDAETETTLYFLLAGDPEPKALPFRLTMIAQCGSGLYTAQHNAIMFIRRTLKKMGILSA